MGALAAVGETLWWEVGVAASASSWAQWAVRVDCGLSSLPKLQKTVAIFCQNVTN